MPSITYVQPDGRSTTVDAVEGVSVMRAALQNGVPGIVGECGGQAMCATCHVYVDPSLELREPSDDEAEMLECTAAERTAGSRLGCQIKAGTDFEDIEVRLPETQV